MEKMAPGPCKLAGTSRISDLEKNCFETNLQKQTFILAKRTHMQFQEHLVLHLKWGSSKIRKHVQVKKN